MEEEKGKLVEKDIKKVIIKISKKYIGKGPEYVKVKINNDIADIVLKGIISNTVDILLEQGENNLVQIIWEKLRSSYEGELSDEFYESAGKKLEMISELSDFQEDIRKMTLKVVK